MTMAPISTASASADGSQSQTSSSAGGGADSAAGIEGPHECFGEDAYASKLASSVSLNPGMLKFSLFSQVFRV